ncbi:MAG TPA: hypothetical protein VHE30_03025 [Polyangiaceae bacterium]|nr:hypothetical protein [Polyangiaceae bacterium]
MSAWSFKKGSALESTSRLIAAESLDGERVRGKLVVHFDRPLPAEVAAEILVTLNRAIETIIGEELCEGRLPFTGEELVDRVRKRARSLPSRISEMRVEGLELLEHKATLPSRVSSHPHAHRSDMAAPVPTSTSTSGVMPKVSVESNVRTLWPRATQAVVAGTSTERLVRLFAPALRDSVAVVMMGLFQSLDPSVMDRLELFERRAGSAVADRVREQVCTCLAAAFHRVLVRATVDGAAARALVESMLEDALAPEPPHPEHLERYLESPAPLRELTRVVAAALGVPGDADRMLAAVSAYGMALRPELEGAAGAVKRLGAA